VNNGKLLIADLGLSKKLAEVTTNSKGNKNGVLEYIEPQCFKNLEYKKNKKSDIYSLGVLLWEISSGRPPFSNHSQDIRDTLAFHIAFNGVREIPIKGTPSKYQELYQKCWHCGPTSRPNIEEVHETLSQLNSVNSFDLQSPQLNIHNIDDNNNLKVNNDADLVIPSNYLYKSKFNILIILIKLFSLLIIYYTSYSTGQC
jgi:hypothetical protein